MARPVADHGMPPVRLGSSGTKNPATDKTVTPRQEPGPIQVHIGTVEVRASTPPPAPRQPPEPGGFDGYLAVRTYAGWEGT
ncbi:MAG: hypothetical protein H0U55_14790 [Rubrobacteraceae bacterium]|nr:hypothetical protein [Rubrobacteraceae bacterium]